MWNRPMRMGSCCSTEEPGYPVTVLPPPTAPPPQYQPYPPQPYPPAPPPPTTLIHPSSWNNDTAYKWVRRSAGEPIPHTAVVGGRDVDGAQIYVGRADHDGDVLPAKVIPEKNVAYVAHAGREWAKHTFELLTVGEFNWVFSNNGSVPPDAVVAGHTSSGEPLYIGRVLHHGAQTIGKVQPSHGCVYIPFNGEELSFRDYEVLVMH